MSYTDRLKSLGIGALQGSKLQKEDLAKYIIELHESGEGATGGGHTADFAELKRVLLDVQRETRGMHDDLGKLTGEMAAYKAENATIKTELQGVRKSLDKMTGIINDQQRFLEKLDAQQRAKNIIVIGLSENENINGATDDSDKVQYVMRNIGATVNMVNVTCKRLGQTRSDGSSRPLLVMLEDEAQRNDVLLKATQKAGDRGDLHVPNINNTLRIKRDQHPAVRAEWGRLFRAVEAEKQKPENAGVQIVFDRKNRVITRAGEIIDRWCANFQ